MKTFYVQCSSWFDTHKYDTKSIITAIRLGGGKNIRLESQYGWANQPEVVVFTWNTADDQLEVICSQFLGVAFV